MFFSFGCVNKQCINKNIGKNKSWRFIRIHENSNEFMEIHVNSCEFMGVHGCSWVFMGVHGCSCVFMCCFCIFFRFYIVFFFLGKNKKPWLFFGEQHQGWQFPIGPCTHGCRQIFVIEKGKKTAEKNGWQPGG